MNTRSLVGIMVEKRSVRKQVLRLYQRHCPPDIELYAFCAEDIRWKRKRINGLSLNRRKWKQRLFPFPRAVYNRCFNRDAESVRRLTESMGPNRCFNMVNFFNKWTFYNLLKASGVTSFLPDTFVYQPEDLGQHLERYGMVFIKPFYGAQGKSVFRVERLNHEEINVSLHSLAASFICKDVDETMHLLKQHLGTGTYLIQQGIQTRLWNRKHFDIRVLMQKNKSGAWAVSNIASRIAYRQYFNTAVCEEVRDADSLLSQLFDSTELNVLFQTLHQTSILAAREAEQPMGLLGELSVDYVVDEQDKLWIIEINGKPQKSIYSELPGYAFKTRIYKRPLEYAGYLARGASESTERLKDSKITDRIEENALFASSESKNEPLMTNSLKVEQPHTVVGRTDTLGSAKISYTPIVRHHHAIGEAAREQRRQFQSSMRIEHR